MMNSKRIFVRITVAATVLLAAAAFPTPATADTVLNFGFQNLASNFVSTGVDTGTFTAISQSTVLGSPTLGSVTREVWPEGWAQFSWWTGAGGIGAALVDVELLLTEINQVTNTAQATGDILLRDVDGETITGTITGSWSLDGDGRAHFDGTAFNLSFNPETGGWFDGNLASPGFDMDFTDFENLIGSIVDLAGVPAFGFFRDSWTTGGGEPIFLGSGMTSIIIPAPGAFLLGAMGLSLVGWVKRKFA